jgi:hypothetical protein
MIALHTFSLAFYPINKFGDNPYFNELICDFVSFLSFDFVVVAVFSAYRSPPKTNNTEYRSIRWETCGNIYHTLTRM